MSDSQVFVISQLQLNIEFLYLILKKATEYSLHKLIADTARP